MYYIIDNIVLYYHIIYYRVSHKHLKLQLRVLPFGLYGFPETYTYK